MFYFDTPNYSVALNAKVASSSLARAIVAAFQPEVDFLIRTAEFPPGVTEGDRQWHAAVRGRQHPTKPVVLLVREPAARFVTACQQVRIRQGDIDAAIASLVNGTGFARVKPPDVSQDKWDAGEQERRDRRRARAERKMATDNPVPDGDSLRDNVHFFMQSGYLHGPTTCFQFPRDINAAASFLGLESPLPQANKAKRPKPELSASQQAAVLAYYASDVALFDSITQPATVITP